MVMRRCPVCGSLAVYYDSELKGMPRHFVGCDNIQCSMCGPFAPNKERAIELWNSLYYLPNTPEEAWR